jgi:hypothetical protein
MERAGKKLGPNPFKKRNWGDAKRGSWNLRRDNLSTAHENQFFITPLVPFDVLDSSSGKLSLISHMLKASTRLRL